MIKKFIYGGVLIMATKSKKGLTSTTTKNVVDTKQDSWFDDFLKKFPLDQLVVFGENILRIFVPSWNDIKKEIIYFIMYAEYVSKKEGQDGKEKKQEVENFIYQRINKFLPMWMPSFIVESIIGVVIDMAVKLLNDSFPQWEDEVEQYFDSKKGE